jgi:hypothetical protein
MDALLISLLSGLVGSVIGGALAIWGARSTLRASQRDIEIDELRRLRLDCLVNLVGLRFVIADEQTFVSDDDKSRIMFELNRAVALWADNNRVQNLLRDIRRKHTSNNTVEMLRAMAETTNIPLNNLAESDLNSLFVLRRLD